MKRRQSFLSLILFLVCFLSLSFCVQAKEPKTSSSNSSKVIRVAYPIQEGLTEKDEQGNYSGYTYDYLQEIAQYTGWEYEFVEVEGEANEVLTRMLSMLQSGEVDILGSLSKNEQTEALFDFPEYGYGNSYINLSVTEDNTQINEINLATVKDLRIAAYKNAKTSKGKAEEFCKLNNISFTFVDCDSEQNIIDTVKNGNADVMLGNELSPVEGFRTVAQFSGSQFYFAVQKGRSDLISTLNSTILTIKQIKPYFESTMHEKYFSNRSYNTYLTDAETAFVESADPLRIAVVTSIEPIQYKDSSGNVTGISKAILERVSEETGIKMEYLAVDSFEGAYKMLESKEADAICGIPYDYTTAQKYNLVMSNSFLTSQVVMAAGAGAEDSRTSKNIAILNGRQFYNNDPNLNVTYYDSIQECMKAVSSGKADYSYINFYSAEYLDHYFNYNNLTLIPQSDKTMEFCLGFSKPSDTMLVTLINRGLSNIPASDLEAMVYQNTVGTYDTVTLRSFVEQNPFLIIGIITFIFFVLAVIGIMVFRFRTQANKRLNIENERYLFLSELANEYIYEYDFEKDTLSFSKEFCKLFSLPERIKQASKYASDEQNCEFNPEVVKIWNEATSAKDIIASEHLCMLPDGEQRWFRNTRAEIKEPSGKQVYVIGKLSDIQNEMEEKERLKLQSQLDALTGIYNAVSTKNSIQERINTLSEPCALLILDIDNFKTVNDVLGHYTGDIVLKDFTRMLNGFNGQTDIVGRIGGDEFMYFIQSAPTLSTVEDFCDRLCQSARKTYTGEQGEKLTISTSVGGIRICDAHDFDSLYRGG